MREGNSVHNYCEISIESLFNCGFATSLEMKYFYFQKRIKRRENILPVKNKCIYARLENEIIASPESSFHLDLLLILKNESV